MILNNGEKAYNRVKEERCGSMKIKFDNITAKTAKYCALIFTVLLLIGLVFSFLEIPLPSSIVIAFSRHAFTQTPHMIQLGSS